MARILVEAARIPVEAAPIPVERARIPVETARNSGSGREAERRTHPLRPGVDRVEAEVLLGHDDDRPALLLQPFAPDAIVLAIVRAVVELLSVVLHRDPVPGIGDVEPAYLPAVDRDDPLQLRERQAAQEHVMPGPRLAGRLGASVGPFDEAPGSDDPTPAEETDELAPVVIPCETVLTHEPVQGGESVAGAELAREVDGCP